MKRQQAFIASMAHQAVSADTLANPSTCEVPRRRDQVAPPRPGPRQPLRSWSGSAYQFRHIGLDHIQFVTTPWEDDPSDPNRVVWAPEAQTALERHPARPALPKSLLDGSLNAQHIPGVTKQAEERPAGAGPGGSENLANGLCA